MRKKIKNISLDPTPHQESRSVSPGGALCCIGCSAREEQLIFLREQVRTLQDKLLCLVPEAADRHHRLILTQAANMRPEAMNGIVPLSETIPESEDQEFDHWYNQMSKTK